MQLIVMKFYGLNDVLYKVYFPKVDIIAPLQDICTEEFFDKFSTVKSNAGCFSDYTVSLIFSIDVPNMEQ